MYSQSYRFPRLRQLLLAALLACLPLAATAQSIFVTNYGSNTVGRYSLADGSPINASFISGLGGPVALAIDSSPIPEPSTYAAILGALALGLVAWKRRRAA